MTNPLVRKLERFGPLSDRDRRVLEEVTSNLSEVKAHTDLIEEGDDPLIVFVLMEGFACRYKNLVGGTRQIVAFIVPGDSCNAHVSILHRLDHTIATLSHCKMAKLSSTDVLRMTDRRGAITRALWWSTLVDEAISREWLTNIGRRQALQRVAHLLCEILARLRAVGLVTGDHFELPVTQVELADTVSITNVHMNRVLSDLKRLGLITLRGKNLTILNVGALEELGGFDPDYLYLEPVSASKPKPAAASVSPLKRSPAPLRFR